MDDSFLFDIHDQDLSDMIYGFQVKNFLINMFKINFIKISKFEFLGKYLPLVLTGGYIIICSSYGKLCELQE